MNASLRDAERPWAGDEPASGVAQLIPPGLDAVLVLLRHGQTQFIVEKRFQGAMEAPLTALGEEQARLAGRRLAAPNANPALPIPDAAPFSIVHSPLGRARRSAELVVDQMAAAGRATPPLRSDPGFCEIAQGGWEGLTDEEITARFGDSLAGWRRWPTRFQAPGGETLDYVSARVEAALSTLLTEMAAGTAAGTMDRHQVLGYGDAGPDGRRWSLVVGHSGVFKVVACVLLGLPLEHFWNFDFGLGAITVVEIRAGRAVLRTLNYESHLGGDSRPAAEESAERNASGAL
ncbi:MAG TPA: histidine phosphatase family protein [Candidatus Limnocylindrales bacterium]